MKKTLLALTISALTFNANADAIIGNKLQSMLPGLTDTAKVIVTTHKHDEIQHVLGGLNVPYLSMQTLPMAGATLTKDQIVELSSDDRVKSIYFDAPLEYYNFTSGQITGGHYVHDIEGVTGKGTTIAVLDSGVDATDPDLQLGEKVVQNTKVAGDLDFAGGKNLFLEGLPYTDTSSGHGTHVAGTVAGSGEASRDDARREFYHAGIAPDAQMVGISAGEAVSILYSVAGFDYALANIERYGIDVITNSWGGGDGANFDPNNPINQASYEAYKRGVVVTFAASNSGPDDDTLNQYALAPWVINVAAGTSNKGLADFSSRGVAGDWIKTPDITAPGSGIVSTRAVNTPLGAAGPVVDLNNPDYYLSYVSMSGTSMATPFVAGVVGLMLEVNPDLSPDQIENILKSTAEEMPDYNPHEVGAGYIDVKAAVEVARNTQGERSAFVAGDTDWSSQGVWLSSDETNPNINYVTRWKEASETLATGGTLKKTKRKNAELSFSFVGDSIKINYLASPKNGHAEVFLNGTSKGFIDYYSPSKVNKSLSFRDLDPTAIHSVTLKHSNGVINFDGVHLDGEIVEPNSRIVNSERQLKGTIGPSAENIEVKDHIIKVNDETILVNAVLSWQGIADLDFEMLNEAGEVVANSATLDNPEEISYRPDSAGFYTLRIKGYISALTSYNVDVTTSDRVSN